MALDNVPPVLLDDSTDFFPARSRLSKPVRGLLIGGGLLLAGMLIIAGQLTPDERGFGTHNQLAWLSPCGFMQSTGLPCPTCGMTTAWSHFARGNWWAAIQVHLAGFLLALVSLVVAPWCLVSGLRGRWWPRRPATRTVCMVLIVVGATIGVHWIGKILRYW